MSWFNTAEDETMAKKTERPEELDTPATILGLLFGCGILATNIWVFLQVY